MFSGHNLEAVRMCRTSLDKSYVILAKHLRHTFCFRETERAKPWVRKYFSDVIDINSLFTPSTSHRDRTKDHESEESPGYMESFSQIWTIQDPVSTKRIF